MSDSHYWDCRDCEFERYRFVGSDVAPHGDRHREKTGHVVYYSGPGEPRLEKTEEEA